VVNCAQNQFLVGGTVSGLGAGNTIHIELNGAANSLFVTSNGQFAFPSSLSSGTAYTVTITANPMTPISQTCAVTGGGSGTIMGASVTNVMVACTTISYTISGTVQGLGAGDTLTLLDTLTNTTDTLNLSSSSSFTFADAVPSGDFYNISITSPTSPVSQSCVLDPSSATPLVGTVASSNVTGILITCTTNTFTIGGTVTGLAANDTLTVKDAVAGNSNLITSASPSFTLATALPSGSTYDVTIGVQGGSGANQTCVVSGSSGMGTVANANVTNVAITCTTNSYLLSVTVDGLMAGNSMVLTNNDTGLCASGCTITPTSNVEMLMVPSLTSYSFRFTTPTTPAQTCTPPSPLPAGQVTNAPVALTINCSAVAENLEVNVAAGLAGTVTVSDPDTGGGSRNITATGLATQWTPNAGSAYAVTIVPNTCSPSNAPAADVCFVPGSAAPTANQTCTITNPNNGPAFSGTMPNSALTADISCTTNKFTLGGYVTGLDAANFNILHVGSGQPSGSQSTPISGNDGYAFANPVTSGTEFNVLFTTGTQQYIAPAGTSLTGTVVRIGGATPANWQQCQINNQAPGGVTGQLTYMGNVAVPSSPGTSAGGVNIACVPAYSLGGTVTFPTSAGGSGLVLTNTVSLGGIVIGTDTTAVISGTGTAVPFTMNSGGTSNPTPLAKGDTWSVAVTTTATGRTCNVTTGATGAMGTANVTNLVVTCM